jgi:hypothetical protein
VHSIRRGITPFRALPVAWCVASAAYVHPGGSLEVVEGTVECFLPGQYRSGERECGLGGGRSGSIPDSIPVTSLEGKIEGERKTLGRVASGRNGGWCSRDFPGVPATYRSLLSDGAATAVAAAAAAAAAGAPTCETTCSRHGVVVVEVVVVVMVVVVVVVLVVVVYISPFRTLAPLACGRLFRKVLIDRDLRRRESSRARRTRHSSRRQVVVT